VTLLQPILFTLTMLSEEYNSLCCPSMCLIANKSYQIED